MPNEIANRYAKAQRFADRLEASHDAEAVANFDDDYWSYLAGVFGEDVPSQKTRAMILDIMFDRETMDAVRDPYAALWSSVR